jgi:hypothetical protein
VTSVHYGQLAVRMGIDLGSMGIMAGLITARRPRRGLVMVYASFNVGLFVVLIAITTRSVGAGVGFGLFALLSIVRLRSEPISNPELSYFFCALVLGLVNGVGVDSQYLLLAMNAVVLACLFVVDHPRLHRRTARQIVTLDGVFTDPLQLRVELEHRLDAEVVEFSVQETDYVREITRVSVRYGLPVGAPEAEGVLADVS